MHYLFLSSITSLSFLVLFSYNYFLLISISVEFLFFIPYIFLELLDIYGYTY